MSTSHAIRRLQIEAQYDADDADLANVLTSILRPLDPIDRRTVVRHVYWCMPEIPTTALSTAVGDHDALLKLAGRGPIENWCVRCGLGLRATSRDREVPSICHLCSIRTGTPQPVPPVSLTAPRTAWEYEPSLELRRGADPLSCRVGLPRRWAEDYPTPGVP